MRSSVLTQSKPRSGSETTQITLKFTLCIKEEKHWFDLTAVQMFPSPSVDQTNINILSVHVLWKE